MTDQTPLCGHEVTANGSQFVCALRSGHTGPHEDQWWDRDGRIVRTNYEDDGKIPSSRRMHAIDREGDRESQRAKSLHDLPIFGWAWEGDARDIEQEGPDVSPQ